MVTAIITAAKLVDAVSDPVMGSLVDMTRTRWGKMRPYILFSAAPVAVLSTLLFAIPDVSETGKLVFFGICYFLWGFAYTVCDVPFWGLIGSAFPDSTERTRRHLARAGVRRHRARTCDARDAVARARVQLLG